MKSSNELLRVVEVSLARFHQISDAEASRSPAPGKWSPKEIIGHLIDSASNNHQRFVRAQFEDDLIFPGYAQDEWVRVQRYAHESWESLLILWSSFNIHLASVMANTPAAIGHRPRTRHNLHQIAFSPVAESDPVTLDWFMADYVEHLKHHVDQINRLIG